MNSQSQRSKRIGIPITMNIADRMSKGDLVCQMYFMMTVIGPSLFEENLGFQICIEQGVGSSISEIDELNPRLLEGGEDVQV